MLCSGDMFKLYYRLVFVESSRLSWSTKVLTEAKNLGTFHIFKNSAILCKCCYGFKLSSPVSPRGPMTCADVIQLCRQNKENVLVSGCALEMVRRVTVTNYSLKKPPFLVQCPLPRAHDVLQRLWFASRPKCHLLQRLW